ncbi:MAG: acyl carrier protein [Planctomycetes bacterium]|nr:acyl carrier protein [Planctomycetota bacterium]
MALGARRTFAKVGKIDAASLRATDRFYPDLAELPLYDSLDILTIVLDMEQELGLKLDSEDLYAAFEPLGRKSSPTVGEVIKKLIALVADNEPPSN